MKTSVELQEPFQYALWPVLLSGAVALGILLYFLLPVILRKIKAYKERPKKKKPVVKRNLTPEAKARIKGKYIAELNAIGSALMAKKISNRTAYQKMSVCVRRFVYDMTGIKVQNYTLMDIQKLGIPILTELIGEYYAPEFSRESYGDVHKSIAKTKWVIERWN